MRVPVTWSGPQAGDFLKITQQGTEPDFPVIFLSVFKARQLKLSILKLSLVH